MSYFKTLLAFFAIFMMMKLIRALEEILDYIIPIAFVASILFPYVKPAGARPMTASAASAVHPSPLEFPTERAEPNAQARLRLLEDHLDEYDEHCASRLQLMVETSRSRFTDVDEDHVALLRHRTSVSFLRQYATTSSSAAILYEAALHRDIGLREFALGRHEPAVRHYAASMLLDLNVFLTEDSSRSVQFITVTWRAMVTMTMQTWSSDTGCL